MYKRLTGIAAIAVTAFMITVLVPSDGSSAGDYDEEYGENMCGDNVTWVLDGTKLTISGTGPMYDEFHGVNVWGDSATEVVVEKGVTYISGYAFAEMEDLKTATLADSVVTIGREAFRGCSRLTGVSFGEGLETIEAKSFYKCFDLASIALPSNLKTIGEMAFYSTDITYVMIPDSCTEYSKAFDHNVAVLKAHKAMDDNQTQTVAIAIAAVGTLLCVANYIIGRRR